MKTYQVILVAEAEQDLDEIFDYILLESQNFNIAESFTKELLLSAIETLSFMPNKHPIYKNKVHRLVFPKHTSYSAFFKIDEEKEAVFILAITDTKQFTRYMKL